MLHAESVKLYPDQNRRAVPPGSDSCWFSRSPCRWARMHLMSGCHELLLPGSGSSTSNSTIYTAPSGARVLASGTIQWSWGLDNYSSTNYANAGAKKMTANLLNNFTEGGIPLTATPTAVVDPPTATGGGSHFNSYGDCDS